MSDLLKAHPPGTRPLLLTRDPVLPAGYIGQTIFAAIQAAHAAVDDLAAGADPASLTLETARRSLYLAESRWWSRPGVSPEEASAGLAYAVQAETISEDALGQDRPQRHEGRAHLGPRRRGDAYPPRTAATRP